MRRALGTVLLVAGLLVLADVAVTMAWQEPVSALRAGRAQHRLAGELRRLELAVPAREAASAARAASSSRLASAARRFART
ncbi:MAG TPA: hypothetical protein VK510_10495, partial [Solirubrobacteraceae bacterium]|nr:hypothetical protein [Solirubrobacteraceae bacterium]